MEGDRGGRAIAAHRAVERRASGRDPAGGGGGDRRRGGQHQPWTLSSAAPAKVLGVMLLTKLIVLLLPVATNWNE